MASSDADLQHQKTAIPSADRMDRDQKAELAAASSESSPSRKRQHESGESNGARDDQSTFRNNKRNKRGDMGRKEYFRNNPDKRAKIDAAKQSRQDNPDRSNYGVKYTADEISAEERRPKKKVAVFIGYAGTGYKGMQISPAEKTIEGDLFTAFVKAGAISKANAEDPRKVSLVRCARTDKGVHAAGNMISLKLIVEDEKIVEKINAELPEQIRIWGFERTINSFSCYQACDSRWYEYLIPSYAFLPPHPSSYMGKQLEKLADEANDREAYESRQEEVKGFWDDVDAKVIEPILQSLDEDIRDQVREALFGEDEVFSRAEEKLDAVRESEQKDKVDTKQETQEVVNEKEQSTDAVKASNDNITTSDANESEQIDDNEGEDATVNEKAHNGQETTTDPRTLRLRAAVKELRQAYMNSKRQYRIPAKRVDRVQAALSKYTGTKNYHNYTVDKTFKDPSSQRIIRSFVVDPKTILIGDGDDDKKTEWLSMKVHGQSFMMHQIRKMIGMITLLVRCGSDLSTMDDSFTSNRYSIPKVPGLGLMLERPVFSSYNKLQAAKFERGTLTFDKFEKEIEEFKHRQIYTRMFAEEESKAEFARFFNHVDNFPDTCFLYVSSKGHAATEGAGRREGYGELKQREQVSKVAAAE